MRKTLIGFGILAVVVGVPVVKSVNSSKGAISVETAVLSNQVIEASILASGTLTHEEEVHLTSEEIGKVKAVYVEEGDWVTRGQLVLEIDDEAHVAAVEQSAAAVRMQEIAITRQQLRIDNLEKRMERNRQLYRKKLLDEHSFDNYVHELELARVDFDSGKESLKQQQAQLQQAKNRLSKTKVYAPIKGVVTSLDIEVGETAITSTTNIAGSSLMTIANPASIQTEVYVDEADVADIAVGQRAEVVAIAYADSPVSGVVSSVAISAKQAKGKQGLSFAVKINLNNTEGVVLRPGMSCRAEMFTHGEQQVPAVPIQALLVDEDISTNETNYYVFAFRDGVARRVEVDAGAADDQYQEITAGLTIGDSVVVGPNSVLRNLKDGDEVVEAAD